MTAIVVHHLENSRSQRVLWLLEELGLEYRIERYERDPVTMLAPASLADIHPLGKSPVIVDGARTLAESGAIVEYLVERYGKGALIPAADTENRDRYRYWLHYAEGSLMPLLLIKLLFDRMSKPPMPFPLRPFAAVISTGVKAKFTTPRLTQHMDYIEAELEQHRWFAGNAFSAADVQMSFPLEAARERQVVGDRPAIVEFLQRIHAREAYQRALERGGPYAFAD